MCLTAHQRLRLLRRCPEAKIQFCEEFGSIFVLFPNGDSIWGMPGARSEPGSVLPVAGAGYHAPVVSEATLEAEAMLREFLGCD